MPTIALVGAAHIHTPQFVKTLQGRRESISMKYVWDHDTARAAKSAGELGATVVADVNAIWADPGISAVIICAETDRHEALALPAAATGKHLFIEKPLGFGARDALALADAIERAGVIFQTGYFMRGTPIHQFLYRQIQQGTFGKITRIRHANCHSGSLGGWFDTEWRWMADPTVAGVGAFGDLGTHSLDILLWFMGEVTRATAQIDVATARYGDCDEYGEGMIRFRDGAIGTLAAGWVDVANPLPLVISGTEGHAYVRDGKLYFNSRHVEGADGKEPWVDLPAPLPHAFELFLDAIGGATDLPLVSAREAAYRNVVMTALYEGARRNTWVDLAPQPARA